MNLQATVWGYTGFTFQGNIETWDVMVCGWGGEGWGGEGLRTYSPPPHNPRDWEVTFRET